MELGISSYTLTWSVGVPGYQPTVPTDASGLIDWAVDLGLKRLQIADNYPLVEKSQDEWEQLREKAREKNVLIEVGGRGLTPDNLEKHIALSVFFGSPITRMVIDRPGFEPSPAEVVQIIRERTDLLESAGTTLALENHDRLHSSVFRQIVKEVNHPLVGICLDSVNSMGIAEGLETVIENLAPYTVNLHVKDFSIRRLDHKMGFVIEGTPAGKGLLNFPWILEQLSRHHRCQSAILELWTPPDADLNRTIEKENRWTKESIDYLKPFFD